MKKRKVLTICLIGVFSALCFASLYVKIPMPSPVGQQMIHFGNAITIVVALIFGPIVGGLSGAIGMTIYDLLDPIYITSAPKTFILKLGIGLIAGFVFIFLRKKEFQKIKYFILGFGILFLGAGLTIMTTSLVNNNMCLINAKEISIVDEKIDLTDYSNGTYYLSLDGEKYIVKIKDDKVTANNLEITDKLITNVSASKALITKTAITFHWASYIFPIILGVLLIVTFFFVKSLPYLHTSAIIASICAVIFNIIGEFIGKFIMQMIIGQGFTASIIKAYVSLPAPIINACLCVIVIGILFPSLHRAFKIEDKELEAQE